ncbi:MAG TPA: phosphatase PAP2 family protein [Gammaproteobacteria bacterium]|nr:phosphatase PAP2 family protein [Gammaproteobacteria bacterium]
MIRHAVYSLLDSASRLELAWCIRLQRRVRRPGIRFLFRLASRLGDGIIWYALMVLLPILDGLDGLGVSLELGLTALACLAIYRATKTATARPRPWAVSQTVRAGERSLDPFSFPSGHTLQAVAMTTIAVAHYPPLALVLVPFTLLVAGSRVVLGLHYPSDVLAGALIGLAVALPVVLFVP